VTAPAIAFVDFETRSRADLKAIGGRRYAEHPSTEVVCAVLWTPAGDRFCYSQHVGPCPMSVGRRVGINDGWRPPKFRQLAAHNAINFDRHIWALLGWPEPDEWIDTAEITRVAGFPQASLEWLGENLVGKPKDLEGNALTKRLSSPEWYYGERLAEFLATEKAEWKATHAGRLPTAQIKAKCVEILDGITALGGPGPAPIPTDVLCRVFEYCGLDVEVMAGAWSAALWEWHDADLPGLVAADRALNDRGICFDRELAQILIDASEELARTACAAAGVPASLVRSNQQLALEFVRRGSEPVVDCTADTIAVLAKSPIEHVALLAKARQSVASIAVGKLEAGLARCSPDGRLRDNRTYMGAHTGRWAGKGMQLDNLAKGL
jgi:hypothetical protein